jgi:hypothetical protein
MNRRRRYLSSLAVIGLSAWIMAQGWALLRYSLADLTGDASSVSAKLTPFMDDPRVGALARSRVLALVPTDEAQQRVEEVQEFIARAPLTGGAWLELAMASLASGEPTEKVASALMMAHVTAPNEARQMAMRAVFGLPLWDLLPQDARASIIADLVGGWSFISDTDHQVLRGLLSTNSGETRESIRARLLLIGKPGAPIIKYLGLAPRAAPAPPLR